MRFYLENFGFGMIIARTNPEKTSLEKLVYKMKYELPEYFHKKSSLEKSLYQRRVNNLF